MILPAGRVASGSKHSKYHWSGRVGSVRVKRASHLAGRVRSGQGFFESHGWGRVGSRIFKSHGSGRVGSGEETMKSSRVGSGHDPRKTGHSRARPASCFLLARRSDPCVWAAYPTLEKQPAFCKKVSLVPTLNNTLVPGTPLESYQVKKYKQNAAIQKNVRMSASIHTHYSQATYTVGYTK